MLRPPLCERSRMPLLTKSFRSRPAVSCEHWFILYHFDEVGLLSCPSSSMLSTLRWRSLSGAERCLSQNCILLITRSVLSSAFRMALLSVWTNHSSQRVTSRLPFWTVRLLFPSQEDALRRLSGLFSAESAENRRCNLCIACMSKGNVWRKRKCVERRTEV